MLIAKSLLHDFHSTLGLYCKNCQNSRFQQIRDVNGHGGGRHGAEGEAEEGELEGPMRHMCKDMELEEGDTELEESKLAEEGELAGPAEEGVTHLRVPTIHVVYHMRPQLGTRR